MGSPVALRSHEMHEHLQFCARTKEPGPPADEQGLCSSEVVLQAAGRAPLPANRQVTFLQLPGRKWVSLRLTRQGDSGSCRAD